MLYSAHIQLARVKLGIYVIFNAYFCRGFLFQSVLLSYKHIQINFTLNYCTTQRLFVIFTDMNHTQPLFTTQQPTLSNEMDGGADQMSSKHLTHSSRKRRLSGEHNASRKMVKSAQVSEKFATDFGESFMPLTLQWDGHDGRRMSVSKDIFNLICPAFGAMVSGKWADAIEDKIKMHDEDHPDALNHVMAAAHHRPAIWGADLQNPSIPTLIHLLILNDKYDIKFMKNQIFEWIEACQEDRRARGLPSSKYVKEDGLYRILAVWGVFTYGNQHQLFDCADVLSEVASNTRPDILRDFQLPQDGGGELIYTECAVRFTNLRYFDRLYIT